VITLNQQILLLMLILLTLRTKFMKILFHLQTFKPDTALSNVRYGWVFFIIAISLKIYLPPCVNVKITCCCFYASGHRLVWTWKSLWWRKFSMISIHTWHSHTKRQVIDFLYHHDFAKPFLSHMYHFFAKVCNATTRQPIELESCSNHLQIQQVF